MSDIVERLRGTYRVPITDALGPAGGEEPDNADFFVRTFPTSPLAMEAAAEIERLRADIVDVWRTFDAMWNANQRAIKRWHAAGNPETVWPDHADMVVWLLERLSAAEAQRDALVAAAGPVIAETAREDRADYRVRVKTADIRAFAAAVAGARPAQDGGAE